MQKCGIHREQLKLNKLNSLNIFNFNCENYFVKIIVKIIVM